MGGIITSRITERSQTTLPPAVRKVLGLLPGDALGYVIEGSAVHLVNPSEAAHTDPALEPFLLLLKQDITARPERLAGFPAELLARIQALTDHVKADHDAAINGVVAL